MRARPVRRTAPLAPAAAAPAAASKRKLRASTSPLPASKAAKAEEPGNGDATATSAAASRPPTAVLVFAPGAGGATANAMRALHVQLEARGMAVWRCDDQTMGAGERRWVTQNAGHTGNLSHVLAVTARAAAAHPNVPLVLIGASFGCRVLAELLSSRRAELPATAVADAVVCCGFPLHAPGKPEGADPRRAAHLLSLPSATRVLFVQGADDEFLGVRGMQALHDVRGRMAARSEVHVVACGEHTVPHAKSNGLKALGTTREAVAAGARDAIIGFVTDLLNLKS